MWLCDCSRLNNELRNAVTTGHQTWGRPIATVQPQNQPTHCHSAKAPHHHAIIASSHNKNGLIRTRLCGFCLNSNGGRFPHTTTTGQLIPRPTGGSVPPASRQTVALGSRSPRLYLLRGPRVAVLWPQRLWWIFLSSRRMNSGARWLPGSNPRLYGLRGAIAPSTVSTRRPTGQCRT